MINIRLPRDPAAQEVKLEPTERRAVAIDVALRLASGEALTGTPTLNDGGRGLAINPGIDSASVTLDLVGITAGTVAIVIVTATGDAGSAVRFAICLRCIDPSNEIDPVVIPPTYALINRGSWAEGGVYAACDVVKYSAAYYLALIDQPQSAPGVTPGEWDLFGGGGGSLPQGLDVTDSPEFADTQITTLAANSWLGNTAKSARSFLTALLARLYDIVTATKDPTGWIDNDNITVTGDYVNRTVTVTHPTELARMWRGKKTVVSGNSWTSTAHGTTADRYFLYSEDGINFAWSEIRWPLHALMVALAIKDPTTGNYYYLREPHGTMPWQAHRSAHLNIGTRRNSGCGPDPATYTVNTATDAATRPGYYAGEVDDDSDITTAIAATAENSYTTLRIGANGAPTFDLAATFPFRSSGSFPLVNNPTVGTEAATVTGRHVNVYELLLPVTADAHSQQYRRVLLQPQTAYTSLPAAQAEDTRGLSLGALGTLAEELVFYSRITYLTSAGDTNTGKCRIATNGVSYVVGSRMSQINVTATLAATTAENVSFTPSGSIAATNAQAAIEELDAEKVALANSIDYANPIAINTATTLTIGKHHIINDLASPANYTCMLPPIAGNIGKRLSIAIDKDMTKKFTIDGDGSELIGGELDQSMWAQESAELEARADGWAKVGGKNVPRQVLFLVKQAGDATQSINSGSWTRVTHSSVTDPFGIVSNLGNATTEKFTLPKRGVYLVEHGVQFDTSTWAVGSQIYQRVNGSSAYVFRQIETASALYATLIDTTSIDVATLADTYIEVYQSSGVAKNMLSGGGNYTSITWIGGW